MTAASAQSLPEIRTRTVSIGATFVHSSGSSAPAVFQIEPVDDQPVEIRDERWEFEPAQQTHSYRDLYGNRCRRMRVPAGRSVITYAATAIVPDAAEERDESAAEHAPEDLPDDVLMYTLPSRYCLPDMLGNEAWSRFGGVAPGLSAGAGDLRPRQPPSDVRLRQQRFLDHGGGRQHQSGYGVCRDFTHLAISFCRALNIPARYVFGYLPGHGRPVDAAPMDFAAWMEVWLGDRWWTFDPRNNQPRKGRILIGRGRDASDVAMVTTFGAPYLESMTVVAEEMV